MVRIGLPDSTGTIVGGQSLVVALPVVALKAVAHQFFGKSKFRANFLLHDWVKYATIAKA